VKISDSRHLLGQTNMMKVTMRILELIASLIPFIIGLMIHMILKRDLSEMLRSLNLSFGNGQTTTLMAPWL